MSTDEPTNEIPSAPSEPREQPPPGEPRRLLRYPHEGPGAGVCAGLGAYFGVDPVLFRIAFVILAFAGGSGVLLYLLAWMVVPAAPEGSVPQVLPREHRDRVLPWVGIGLIVFAGLWLTAQFDLVSPPVLWALALIVVGVLLFRGDLPRSTAAAPADRGGETPVPAAEPAPAGGWDTPPAYPPAPTAGAPGAYPPAPPGPPGAYPPAPPAPPRPPSILGRVVLGVALAVAGGVGLLDTAGLLDVGARHYTALALLVVGLGLLVGAWWGRSRGLILVGLLLVPLAVLTSVAGAFDLSARGGTGHRYHAPASVAELQDRYELFGGQMDVDLSAVDLAGESATVRAVVTFGELRVVVPPEATVTIVAHVGGGEIRLPPEDRDAGGSLVSAGVRVERMVTLEGDPGGGDLDLDLTTGFGTLSVRRAP